MDMLRGAVNTYVVGLHSRRLSRAGNVLPHKCGEFPLAQP